MSQYDHQTIEAKWQKNWETEKIFQTPAKATRQNKFYILPQLPYPSGEGLHVGHAEVYAACDIYARYQRLAGKKVLQVIGWDSFGLPAENYAIKSNIHPRISTDKAIDNFRSQIKKLGISVDWDREVGSHNSDYYKWTQWFFLLFYKRGLAYRKKQAVNWCDSCKTVLANEQVTTDGKCERCSTVVEQREMEEWYLKITDYAERLLEGLDKIDWPEESKKRQRDWIGKSEGAEIEFAVRPSGRQADSKIKVFTTRPDTLFGATYLVLAPESDYVQSLKSQISNWQEVEKYINATKLKTDLDRQIEKEKTGVELQGVKAINPATGQEIPIYIADYVLSGYGTGAIMAVPAHDERDWEFAKKFKLPIVEVVAKQFGEPTAKSVRHDGVAAILLNQKNQVYVLKTKAGEYELPVGRYNGDESDAEALSREIIEETGFTDFEIKDCLGTIQANFYIKIKNLQRLKYQKCYVVNLKSEKRQALQLDEFEAQEGYSGEWQELSQALVLFEKYNSNGQTEFIRRAIDRSLVNYTGDGVLINSGEFDGLKVEEAKKKITEKVGGKLVTRYKLRDWSVSRQRFWGAPIPILYDDKGQLQPVPEKDLPVILPDDVDFKPTGESPLNYSKSFNAGVEEKYGKGWKREPDTLDTFMCSSWYYYRYLDPHNDKAFASPENLKAWMPVDFYLGGPEHVNGHLLYSRFFTKVLFDAGYIDFDEPFLKHRHQGLILGEDNRKMSKRWNNSINPTDVANQFGADTLRIYEMFMGPLEQDKPWDTNGVKGVRRFLEKIWKLADKPTGRQADSNQEIDSLVHKTIKKVGEDIEALKFNTAVSALMILVNAMTETEAVPITDYRLLIVLLSPFAPHLAEELWSNLGNKKSIALESWPEYDRKLVVDENIKLVVQVNGKLRDMLEAPAGITEAEATRLALGSEKVKVYLAGAPKKIIFVPGKLINIVI
ncbi:MAG: class I tRNA ligase family protein [Patescibacteria group bacterium]|jgi:leucyl-tRNA synthetase